MKKYLYALAELVYFLLISLPVAALVITAVYVGFFLKDLVGFVKKKVFS